MKKWIVVFCYIAFAKASFAQDSSKETFPSIHNFEASYLYGAILEHNPDIAHLISDHPTGIMLRYNRKTFGENEWESRYGYPDWGISGIYQDMKNRFLGEAYGAYGHYNFYFLNRNLNLSIGTGLAWMTKPFDPETNARNNAYGSSITSSTYLLTTYKRENIYKGLGLQAGFTIVHYSNANVKAPNNSTNSWLFTAGVNYTLDYQKTPAYKRWEKTPYKEKLRFNGVARFGVNESDVRGSGQYPFYTFSFYVDKRIGFKSSLHAGTEIMISEFLREYRDYQANSFPDSGITGDENFQRIGVFLGHELHLGKTSVITQFGYYVYRPIAFEKRIYNRMGLQRRLNKNLFASLSLKSHGAAAEGVSLGIGYRI
ncbi:acyloxyacyl hydrolase [Nonlabens mediterrranea]|uniref:Acyloxyacyl hydrolase n=1 Tax=Nonlabens mediterrranea TaxID=1419947 RepID=A0ABS0A9V8_9FLAO|nr:acyloxyacyl hydrolase [Nonlabens mediterrranea]